MNLASLFTSPWLLRYFLPIICYCFFLGNLPIEAVAKVKAIYKLLVTDYRGNRWIDYTAVDASTYVVYNGGITFIRDVQVLAHWRVKNEGSLYGKSLTNMKAWRPKQPEVQAATGDPAPARTDAGDSEDRRVGPLGSLQHPRSDESPSASGHRVSGR